MKLSHVLGAVGLLTLVGCGNRGGVDFDYVLLFNDNGNVAAAANCGVVGVSDVRFAVGNDLDGNNTLEEAEELDFIIAACNQSDANGDGVIGVEDLGSVLFNRVIDAGTYDSFSISFLDNAGNFVPWQTVDVDIDAEIFTFQGNTTFTKGDITVLPFIGDGAQVADELQVFFGF
jgi:hypothetical protein